jgi:hypothetical protein
MAQIITHGRGEVRKIADRARASATFAGHAKDRAAAVDALAARVASVEPILNGDGSTVESRRLWVRAAYDGKRRTGSMATQHYTVLVTDLERLDNVIAELVAADPASLSGPVWDLADRTESFGEARRIAVADARAAAQGYADALGGRLGPLIRLEDGSVAGRPVDISMAMASRRSGAPHVAELSLNPEEVTVTATCTTTWELLA